MYTITIRLLSQIAGPHPQRLTFGRSVVGTEHLHFYQVMLMHCLETTLGDLLL